MRNKPDNLVRKRGIRAEGFPIAASWWSASSTRRIAHLVRPRMNPCYRRPQIEPLTQKSLERLAGAACLWKHQAHLSSCESGFHPAAFDEPDNGRRSASIFPAGCRINRRSAKSRHQFGRASLPWFRMLHNLQHRFWNGPDAPARPEAAIVFRPRTCEASCWYKLPVRPEAARTDSVPHHYPNREAHPIGGGVAQFVSFEEGPRAPNLRQQFWTCLTQYAC